MTDIQKENNQITELIELKDDSSPKENVKINEEKKIEEEKEKKEEKKEEEKEKEYEMEIDPELLIDKTSLDIEEYFCPLCKGILNDPIIDKCSHTFCKKCFETFYNKYHKCPISKEILKDGIYTSVYLICKSIGKRKIKCKNCNKGCLWIGKISEMKEHILNDCQKSLIKCPFQNCNIEIIREKMNEHKKICEYRTIECNDCHNNFPFKVLEEHNNICPNKKIPCPQNCGLNIERKDIDNHIKNSCDCTLISCSFKDLGCLDQYKKKDFNNKMQDDCSKHLLLVTQKILDMEKKFLDEINIIKNNINDNNNIKHNNIDIEKDNEYKYYYDYNIEIDPFKSNKIIFNEEEDYNTLNKKRKRENQVIENLNKKNGKKEEKDIDINKNIQNNNDKNNKDDNLIKVYFDLKNLNTNIKINNNIAKFCSQTITEHIFLFVNPIYDINTKEKKIIKWTIKLNNFSKWIAFGICDKEKVIINKGKFCISSKNEIFNNGSYLISNNGYSWNCNNFEENNKKIEFPSFQQNQLFIMEFNPILKQIIFFDCNKKEITKLTNVIPYVEPFKLTPCVVFLNKNDSIEFNWDN